MLDLKLLEEQLDKALALETSESLTSWLLNRRLKKYVSNFGEGTFKNIPSNRVEITQSKEHLINNKTPFFTQDYYSTCDYLIAA
ncbi:MAG: hypothetical protein O9297_14955 [Flavobacterium sp.]|jgi:hypothetical protein|uniref:hypothetical protein n=2 Tax=Flavobacterium sp. TaxID=239 RepID=UPI0022C7FD89|nr:hypothetical protein [Flavobacterium sp.]MCZ8298506.1 hypothetical protein [Flavobacterium sp.]